MKKWYVYELINFYGTVEWVGQSMNPLRRFKNHIKDKPKEGNGMGKFYGRADLVLYIVKEFDTRKESYWYQCNLQKEHGLKTDSEKLHRKEDINTRKKKSLAKIGIKRTDKVKQKISNSMLIYHKSK
jgi:hypothetical protein